MLSPTTAMNATKQVREAMTADERAEYDQLFSAGLNRRIERRGYVLTWCTAATLAVACVVTVLVAGPKNIPPTPWALALAAVLLGGLTTARVLGIRFRSTTEARRTEIAAAASARIPAPPWPPEGEGHDPHVDWVRHPVTGGYRPQEYREQGGRRTARAMKASGVGDYDTFRSNVE